VLKNIILKAAPLALVGVVAITASAQARDQIRIVGSSTVFPFATVVAENFGKSTSFKTPVIESTGSGGGLKLFCAGVGTEHPDITNASRRIKQSEIDTCGKNGVTDIVEFKVGFDGIVIGISKAGPDMVLTKKQIFQALAAKVEVDGKVVENPYKKWSDIDSSLPNTEIEVLGPPPTSGTRDAFVELVMEEAAKEFPAIKALDKAEFKVVSQSLREDGHFIEAGENDNLIVQKLQANAAAMGIFGFSFLDQNADAIKGASVDGQKPTFDAIASGDYGVSRALYFYVKKAHVGVVPGIQEYVNEWVSDNASGQEGYLTDKGLIPLPAAAHDALQSIGKGMTPMAGLS
jgi:phosphate transport system substrate-binding protein